jgi:diguanylate cyclase (GGDEF)-like protein
MVVSTNSFQGNRRNSQGPRIGTFPILLTRWALLISLAYAVILSSPGPALSWPRQLFIAVILVSNLVLAWLLRRGATWEHVGGWMSAADITAVTLAIGVAGNVSTEFYLIYFCVLILAAVVDRLVVLIPLATISCFTYILLLYLELGPTTWRSPELLVRLPVLFGVALYFGTAVQHARREYASHQRKLHIERGHALRALGEMGRLVQMERYPGSILYEIAGWVQQTVEVDRCSVIILGDDRQKGFLAASGDDPSIEVLALNIDKYPELDPAVETGEIIEVHPGDPPDLWQRIKQQLPADSPFRTFLMVPIKRGDNVLGVLYFRDAQPDRHFSKDHIHFCEQAAQMIASFVHEHDLIAQIQSRQKTDTLTGLLTYETFLKQAAEIVARADSEDLCMAIVDIDDIREVNTEWGHSAGNYMIARVGQRFVESMDDAEAVCRYGGDEFLALIRASKSEVKSRLQRRFLDELESDDADLPRSPRASVGIASFPVDGDNAEAILEAAERAMRQAKNDGGQRIGVSA